MTSQMVRFICLRCKTDGFESEQYAPADAGFASTPLCDREGCPLKNYPLTREEREEVK